MADEPLNPDGVRSSLMLINDRLADLERAVDELNERVDELETKRFREDDGGER